MITLSNDFLQIKIAPKGAELVSVVDINHPYEYMWQGIEPYWKRQAPVLFPIIGALKEDTMYVEKVAYHMPKHGFARDMIFNLVEQEEDRLLFELESNEETLKVYPFEFTLQIEYALKNRVLAVSYKVFNPARKQLLFSIGGHPGFSMNLEGANCELVFSEKENLSTEVLDMTLALVKREKKALADSVDTLRLSPSTFDEDALIFTNLKSKLVSLVDHAANRSVTMSLVGVPKLGVWSDKGPFVCLEPWWGIADYVDTNQQFVDKDMIQRLNPQEVFVCGYDLKFD